MAYTNKPYSQTYIEHCCHIRHDHVAWCQESKNHKPKKFKYKSDKKVEMADQAVNE